MWARIIEFMLAIWLAISPFIFNHPTEARFFWINDFSCATLVAFFSLACYHKPLQKLHLMNLLIAFYLITLAYIFRESPYQVPLQNYMVLGLLFLMIGLIPSQASRPPKPWRDFYHHS